MAFRKGQLAKGFTLIELLVVVSIISLLAMSALVAFVRARSLAKETAAKQEVSSLREAVNILALHAHKWPNGCPPKGTSNPEVDLNNAQAAITMRPTIGDQGGGCIWTAEDVAAWDGPYAVHTVDPWGHAYYFDPDYIPYQNCAARTTQAQQVVVYSAGPNGSALNAYDCDDIWLPLE